MVRTVRPAISGQEQFDLGNVPEVGALEIVYPDRRIAASTIIKIAGELLQPDQSEVTERDIRVLTPNTINSGLYVNPYGRDVAPAYKGVVFPPAQFKVLARSPSDLAKHANVGARAAHEDDPDKLKVEAIGMRAAGHELTARIEKIRKTQESLLLQGRLLQAFAGELRSGNFAHYKRSNIIALREYTHYSILEALNAAAGTFKWDEEKTERASMTLQYQLYGSNSHRIKHWIGYTNMSSEYARRRGVIARQSSRDAWRELQKYQPFLDAAIATAETKNDAEPTT